MMFTRTKYDAELKQLDKMILDMGEAVRKAVENAIMAWKTDLHAAAKGVMDGDEEINQQERQIEQLSLSLLLKQQPVAGDLRRVSAALKMCSDLERIGDHAQDIAELSLLMPSPSRHPEWQEVVCRMAKTGMEMTEQALNSYRTGDVQLSLAVQQRDDEVDSDFDTVKKLLASHLVQTPEAMDKILDWLMLAKYLERVADHAVNLAEWAQFSVTGTVKEERLL